MLLRVQDDLRADLTCLQNIIGDWAGIIDKSFSEGTEGERIEILEGTLESLVALKTTLNSQIDELIEKVEKEKLRAVEKIDNPMVFDN